MVFNGPLMVNAVNIDIVIVYANQLYKHISLFNTLAWQINRCARSRFYS